MRAEAAPTTLEDVHAWLTQQGAGLPRWSTGAAALEALLTLLEDRRDDPAFWAELAPLFSRLSDPRVRPELVGDGSSLDDVGPLLDDLRASLPARAGQGARAWARGLHSGRALACFALLTAAVACTGGKDDTSSTTPDDTVPTTEPCDEAVSADVTDDAEVAVYCALVDLIRDADIAGGDVSMLLDCLPAFTAAERANMLDEFLTLDEDALAARLHEIAWDEPCYDGGGTH